MAEDRKRRKGVPPVLTMEQAIGYAEKIYKTTGGQPISNEDLATIFDNARRSSVFILKTAALKAYGLMAKGEDETFVLTPLAIKLFSAASEHEEAAARLEVFRNPPPFAALHSAFAGQILPEPKYLINELKKQVDISGDFYEEWANRFESEGRYAGLVYNDPRNRAAVRRTVVVSAVGSTKKTEVDELLEKRIPLNPPNPPKEEIQEDEYKIPTPSGLIRLYVPKGCAAEDIEIARGLLELISKRLSKEPKDT
jgi:hypothetical protein